MFRKLLIFLACQSALLLAQSNNESSSANAITLRADQGEIDFKNGTAVYTGHVEIAQGGLKVTGDKVTAKINADDKLQTIEASGKPATFRYQPPKEPTILGEGQRLHYDVDKQLLTLEGNAKIQQGDHQTTAHSLSYDLKREKLRSQKVEMIYQVPTKSPSQSSKKTSP
ncbi:MAG: lipopolysaccharide transport periplasmic protein LptA [Cardiobacteriaceae bacterium]|nr:lipopolysaccharide transport periplasmic protein LptA [Cardiobacteriaceae bacterium]